MKNKLLNSFFIIGVLTLCVIAVAMVKTADAKQLYLITDHDISALATCNINPADGRVTDPVYYSPNPMYGAVGIAVDENATTLFISYEMSGSSNFAIVDATTLELIGTVNDPQWGTFTGIDMDDVNNIVYATHRFPLCELYAYDWDPVAKTLTPEDGNPIALPNCTKAGSFGLAVDEINGRLYIAHWLVAEPYVGVYDLSTWEQIMTITPSLPPVGLAVDRVRGFVYATAQDDECAVAPENNTLLSKYDLATGVETIIDMGMVVWALLWTRQPVMFT